MASIWCECIDGTKCLIIHFYLRNSKGLSVMCRSNWFHKCFHIRACNGVRVVSKNTINRQTQTADHSSTLYFNPVPDIFLYLQLYVSLWSNYSTCISNRDFTKELQTTCSMLIVKHISIKKVQSRILCKQSIMRSASLSSLETTAKQKNEHTLFSNFGCKAFRPAISFLFVSSVCFSKSESSKMHILASLSSFSFSCAGRFSLNDFFWRASLYRVLGVLDGCNHFRRHSIWYFRHLFDNHGLDALQPLTLPMSSRTAGSFARRIHFLRRHCLATVLELLMTIQSSRYSPENPTCFQKNWSRGTSCSCREGRKILSQESWIFEYWLSAFSLVLASMIPFSTRLAINWWNNFLQLDNILDKIQG